MEPSNVTTGSLTVSSSLDQLAGVRITWGEATIVFYTDGRLEVTGCSTPDAAAQAFWRAVQRWAPAGMRVILPDEYGTWARDQPE